jgi:hypothetical protein
MTKASRVDAPRRWPMCFLVRKCLNDAALRFCMGVLKFADFTCTLTEAWRIREIRLSMLLSIFHVLSVSHLKALSVRDYGSLPSLRIFQAICRTLPGRSWFTCSSEELALCDRSSIPSFRSICAI